MKIVLCTIGAIRGLWSQITIEKMSNKRPYWAFRGRKRVIEVDGKLSRDDDSQTGATAGEGACG